LKRQEAPTITSQFKNKIQKMEKFKWRRATSKETSYFVRIITGSPLELRTWGRRGFECMWRPLHTPIGRSNRF
jgi:hypothetical protein